MLGRYIDLGNPVNRSHPLNVGLVSWWLPLPNNSGGGTLFDIAGTNHGTLTNAPTWAASTNGFQAVSFSGGSNQYVSLPATAFDSLGSGATIILSVRWTSNSQDVGFGATYGVVTSRQLNGMYSQMILGLDGGSADTSKIAFSPYTASVGTSWGSSPGLNRWRHVAVSWVSGSQTGYLDGVQDYTGTSTGTWQAASGFWINSIGAWAGDGGSYSTSQVASCRMYNRILSAAEIVADYEQTVKGHRDTLRRFSRRAYLFADTGAAAPAGLVWNPMRGPLSPAGSVL